MIRIESAPWAAMVKHAQASYPNECCGAMLGDTDGEIKLVRVLPERSWNQNFRHDVSLTKEQV